MKPGKVLLLVVGPVLLVGGLYVSMRSDVRVASSVTVVDVTTGRVSRMHVKRGQGFPAQNESGEYALYPTEKDGSGVLVISERYREMLQREFGDDQRLKIDLSTFSAGAAN